MKPNLITDEAKGLYMAILNYFIMSCDPAYSRLHSFRNKIMRIKYVADRNQLTKYFEYETKEKISYFTQPY